MALMKGTPGPKERAEPLPKVGLFCCSLSVGQAGQLINNEARKGLGGSGLPLSQVNKEGIQEPRPIRMGKGIPYFWRGTGLS